MSPLLRRGRRTRKKGFSPLLAAAIVVGLTMFVTYYAFNQGLPFVHNFTLYAKVANKVNVIPNSPVRIAGIEVGAVESSTAEGNYTQIEFTVDDNGLPIHTDATVTIRDRLFLEGGYYLALDPGSPSAPTVGDGFTIQPQNTSFPVQFFQLLSTFDSGTRASLENTLNTLNAGFSPPEGQAPTLTNSGAGGLRQAIPQLTPTLKDIAWISQGLRGTQPGDVENLLSSASQVTTTLQSNSSQLADLVTSLNRTSTALATADGALAQSISGLDQTLQVSPGALTAIDRSLPPLASLAVALDPSLKVAPPIVDGVTAAVEQLAAVVAPAERGHLLAALKAAFQQFPSVLTKLAGLLPVTKAVTDCLISHVTPMLSEQVPDGALSTHQPAWQEFVHFIPGLVSSAQSFDANGGWIRYLAGAGTSTLGGPLSNGLISTATPGGGQLQGVSPHWAGNLGPDAFHPEAACATQTLPALTSPATAPDFTPHSSAPATPLTLSQLRSAVHRLARATGR